jgi:hypothetical protein
VRLRIGEREVVLEEGKWSELQSIIFDVSPFYSVAATVRVYVRSLEPEVRIYVSPPGVDPRDADRPISAPAEFAPQLAMQVGLFEPLAATQSAGAYEARVVDEAGYGGHVGLALDWARRATLHEIDQRDAELVVSVFTETGGVLRLFEDDGADSLVQNAYRAMDRIVGDVRRHLPGDAILFVVSTCGSDRPEADVLLEETSPGLRALRNGATALSVVEEVVRGDPGPGVLLSSVPLAAGPVSVLDLAPTVLGALGVPIPAELPGRLLGAAQMKSGATRSRMR